jgi:hypothetical protein
VASDLSRLLSAFRSRKLVVLGDLVADHYVYGQTDRVSREAPVLVVRHESSEVTLGGPANAAANARALGAEVTAVGVLARDEMGEAVRQRFAERGIRLLAVDAPVTETKTRILAGGLNTSRQQMLRLDRGNALPCRRRSPRGSGRRWRRRRRVRTRSWRATTVAAWWAMPRGRRCGTAGSGMLVSADSRYALGKLTGFRAAKPNEPELAALTTCRSRTTGRSGGRRTPD